MEEEFEEEYDMFDEDYERYIEEYNEWKEAVRKKALKDYKEFRRHSNIPYGYVRDWLMGMELVEPVGFVLGFDEVQRYGKIYYQTRGADVKPMNDWFTNKPHDWFVDVLFEKQTGHWDVFVSGLDAEEESGCRTFEWTEYVHQRTEWEDSYYGFIAFSMTDGRYWLLYFKC